MNSGTNWVLYGRLHRIYIIYFYLHNHLIFSLLYVNTRCAKRAKVMLLFQEIEVLWLLFRIISDSI